jgi:hypothetical protein
MVVEKKADDLSSDRCAMMGISTRRFNPFYNSGFLLQLRLIRIRGITEGASSSRVLRGMNEGLK